MTSWIITSKLFKYDAYVDFGALKAVESVYLLMRSSNTKMLATYKFFLWRKLKLNDKIYKKDTFLSFKY